MLNVAIFIGRRLSLRSDSKDSRGKHGAGVWIGVAGIALAMVIMIVSMAVVVGFKQEIRRKISGYNPQISVMPEGKALDNVATELLTPTLADAIRGAIPNAEITPSFELPCILKTDSAFAGVMFRGYVPEADVARFIESSLVSGAMPSDTTMQVALSRATATRLGVTTGESIYAHFFTDGNLRTRKMEISGVFDTHFTEYDGKVAFVPIEVCRKINRSSGDTFTTLEINGVEESDIPAATQRLSGALLQLTIDTRGAEVYTVINILQAGAAYYSWLDLIDMNVVVILILMGVVAAFTLISSLFILILERVRMIGTLRAMGASVKMVRSIFIYLAERILLRGMLWGNVIGLGLVALQHYFKLLPLDADAYYLSYVPATISWPMIVLLNISVIVVSWLVLILPSHFIATISPAESMRYD